MIIIDTIYIYDPWHTPLPPPITTVSSPCDKPWLPPKWYFDRLEAGDNPFELQMCLVRENIANLLKGGKESVKSKVWESSESLRGRPPQLRWDAIIQLFEQESSLAKSNGTKLKITEFAKRNRLNLCSFRRARRYYKKKINQTSQP